MMALSWDPDAAGVAGELLEELVYRSRLLARDRSVCNWGGGNTSSKGTARDFRGRAVEVLHVKGSGSDMASAGPTSFATLLLEPIRELAGREHLTDAEMVDYLAHCTLHPGGPRFCLLDAATLLAVGGAFLAAVGWLFSASRPRFVRGGH